MAFAEELDEFSDLQKNLMNGFFTGGFFSCTRGLIPFGVGSLTGASTVFLLHHTIAYLKEQGVIEFDMRF